MIHRTRFQLAAVLGLFKLQMDNWEANIGYSLRFFLCGILSFLAFSIYELLKGVSIEQQNSLIVAMFGEPSIALLVFYLVVLGYVGLYFTVVAAALFASLLPKNNKSL
ncbi:MULTISPECIES: hypothetical protein [Marinobacter]|uniref:Uncharacterized protein n=1 Tax=Marinobacter nauticus TaxID=2743 RepID=A0A1M2UXU4_MARNT|nr:MULTISPECIES: hypothetical protein [Marinobacter]MBK1875185.1 hypothetical protein [Marinobacter sp. 1-3A]OJT00149.1 hypothetical protein BEE62_08655 [Marinobacter nauticus]